MKAYKLVKSQFGGIPRDPKSNKYFIPTSTCKNTLKDKNTVLEIIKEIKEIQSIRDIDLQKSQILEASMNSTPIIIKIGDNSDIENEYQMSMKLKNIKGFVKFVCYFTCEDNFLEFFEGKRKNICKTLNDGKMKVIIMPYFPLGSIVSYKWNNQNVHILHSSLYLACIAYIDAYIENNFVHGDFHAGNLLLKKTNQKYIQYNGLKIATNGIRPWICDFEKSYIKKRSPQTDVDFLYDIQKLFFLLPTMIHNIDKKNVANIQFYINNIGIDKLKNSDLSKIIIDNIIICKD